MELPFTDRPGRRERHLRRRHRNPLFAWPPIEVEPETLLAAQRADHEEMEAFGESFRDLVQKAVALPPTAGSETVLGLKEELEKLYEQACGLPQNHEREKEALRRLVDLITKAVRQAAGGDPLARRELDEAATAGAIHVRLLEYPLVADILHPETPIGPDELLPSLLSADAEELEAALEIFDADQLALLAAQGRHVLDALACEAVDVAIPRGRLSVLDRAVGNRTAGSRDGGESPDDA
jgi:hypothetical protein